MDAKDGRHEVGDGGTPVRRAVAVVIRGSAGAPGDRVDAARARTPGGADRVLVVLRPPDDPELPDVWGLPAASLRPGETAEEAVRRAGREKLGVELIDVRPGAEGSRRREAYTLEMQLYEASIAAGEPSVPQPVEGVTQYAAWRWGGPRDLAPGAERGSLCCALFIDT